MSFIESQTGLELNSERGRQIPKAGLCVLVVEDDDADAYLIERALSANPDVGAIVRAIDGLEALHLVETGAVDPGIALIDLHMPRKNGFQLLADFAAHRQPCFPMIVLTSSTTPTDAVRSRLRGATRVLTKPDSAEDLEAVLAMALTSARTGVILSRQARSAAPKRGTALDRLSPRPGGNKADPIN